MLKFTGLFILLLVFYSGFSQQQTFTETEKATLDSMFKEDEFMNMLSSALAPKSYFIVSAGIGNSYFSVKNKQLNASQLETKLVFNPSVSYSHKSGLALTATAFLAAFNGRSDFYQYNISPSYSLTRNKKIGTTISFTHTFTRNGYEKFASPIQNDFYGNVYLKKTWLQPGISLGFSKGKYTEYITIDTVLNGTRRIFTDTGRIRIAVFSMNAFVQHEFEYFKLLSRKDGISIKPQLILNAGAQKFSETHVNPFFTRLKARNIDRFKNLGIYSGKNSFNVQSLAFNLDVNYVIGKFGFQPQVYLDYYLPETTDQRFTTVYSMAVNYMF